MANKQEIAVVKTDIKGNILVEDGYVTCVSEGIEIAYLNLIFMGSVPFKRLHAVNFIISLLCVSCGRKIEWSLQRLSIQTERRNK